MFQKQLYKTILDTHYYLYKYYSYYIYYYIIYKYIIQIKRLN